MTNYFKHPQYEFYFKMTDETLTIIQLINRADGYKGITKTVFLDRYNSLSNQTGSFEVISETTFNSVKNDILNYLES